MRVVTLTQRSLAEECRRLQSAVEADGFEPDCILSIRSGGTYVANEIFPAIPHAEVTLRRPGSRRKRSAGGRLLAALLRLLPVWLNDRLRILESQWLRRQFQLRHSTPEGVKEAVAEARGRIGGMPEELTEMYDRILVVDDAVDSGVTLAAVLATLCESAADKRGIAGAPGAVPRPEIRSAAITVTTPDPVVCPDYYLYPASSSSSSSSSSSLSSDGDDSLTLIRFPWAADAKKSR